MKDTSHECCILSERSHSISENINTCFFSGTTLCKDENAMRRKEPAMMQSTEKNVRGQVREAEKMPH